MISSKVFGKTHTGVTVEAYTLENKSGAKVEILTLGGTIRSIIVPDKDGNSVDVALGYDNIADYGHTAGYLGALIGRIGNRIKGGKFTLNGQDYALFCNDGANHLHGGKIGFDKKVWEAQIEGENLILTCFSADGEEGYPGNLDVKVVYSFSDANELSIDYTAIPDKDTIVNLTNHCYFNLEGHASGTVDNHKIKLVADAYTQGDAGCLPTGVIAKVENTPMDFRTAKPIGQEIDADFEQLKFAGGYDHNYVLNKTGKEFCLAAEVIGEKTGITMKVSTDKPGIQFYTGNFLNEKPNCKDGATYRKRSGFCLETQFFPNAMEHKHFPSPIVKAGETYHYKTVYQFGTV